MPCMVQLDKEGVPHFAVNDERKRQHVIQKDLCSICGRPLLRGRWFAGGPKSAFAPNGAYIDPPMHLECVTYAMKVCPYLAARSYSKTKGVDDYDPAMFPGLITFTDLTMEPDRPDMFVVVMTTKTLHVAHPTLPMVQYLKPRRPYSRVQFWAKGIMRGETNG